MNAIEIRQVKKTFSGFMLKDVDMVLPQGYIMGLVGANGAGKTTLIRILMGLYLPDEGDIQIFGQDLRHNGRDVRDQIGFVFDEPKFYDFRLKKVVKLIAPFYSQWDDEQFWLHMEQFKLSGKMKFKELSRGMKLKFALATALSHHARLLILDEPTSGLDPVFRLDFLDLLQEIMTDSTISILFSSHITADVERIADYVTYLRRGELVLSEEKESLRNRFILVRGGNTVPDDLRMQAVGIRTTDYNYEALLPTSHNLQKIWQEETIPSLEQIMFYHERGEVNAS